MGNKKPSPARIAPSGEIKVPTFIVFGLLFPILQLAALFRRLCSDIL